MVRKVNKGLSLVEVIIALAIFLIMMVPIVSALVSGMKTTTTAKELQSRNEYAQNLIETMKEVPIDALEAASPSTSYFEKIGSEGISINHVPGTITAGAYNYNYDKYTITGTTYLGVERTKYSYIVEMSSEVYAVAESLGKENPNNVTSGIVQDLDKDKVAIISATLSNYDTSAYQELLKKKLLVKKEQMGDAYNAAETAASFIDDTGSRIIEITVSKDASEEYDVICTAYYSDNSEIGAEVGEIQYEAYNKHFKNLPDIYLMYNVGVYNNRYANEYITYDVSSLDSTEKVNVFVVETATNYSTSVTSANIENMAGGGTNWLNGGTDGLYRKAGGTDRDSVVTKMIQKNSATGGMLSVYHNMYSSADSSVDSNKNRIEWTDESAATYVGNLLSGNYKTLSDVKKMNEALDGNRGLYEIKVWIQEGDISSIDVSKNPILQGTRGGGEID